ncbi:ABC transporter ATP-binding protein [Candidatus Marimicrobium litorale]|uniref:ATP-binding cassette domain-containing protein n=1 Tax=Candidatus Marimicrobium litorale TaxID=2518991 RepID=A0ABT3T2N7_9GAMM|nr:ATP-binding cassette domain-containing protein [Candidatus Marimicrobium litorale]MCX2975782.1 ATP-binding cassette domain-containing protein [Candidatus Marimicrobium litorale]
MSSSEPKQALIEVREVTMAYGTNVIQSNLTFNIYQGDIFVIMGGSGCGKSTLLKHMLGLITPDVGDILYSGTSFYSASKAKRDSMRQRWGITYQSGGLFSAMTLEENITLPLELYTEYTKAEIKDVVAYKLALVGLAGYQAYYPSEISGGMRKRAALARAIALDPEILFFDEPSAGLDPISSSLLDDLIVQIKESMGATVVMVTHELPSIFAIANNSVYLDNISRTMIEYGNPAQLRDHSQKAVVRQFLSRSATADEDSA